MFVPSRHVAFGKGPRSLVVIPGLSLNDVTVAPDVLKPVFKPFFQGFISQNSKYEIFDKK